MTPRKKTADTSPPSESVVERAQQLATEMPNATRAEISERIICDQIRGVTASMVRAWQLWPTIQKLMPNATVSGGSRKLERTDMLNPVQREEVLVSIALHRASTMAKPPTRPYRPAAKSTATTTNPRLSLRGQFAAMKPGPMRTAFFQKHRKDLI